MGKSCFRKEGKTKNTQLLLCLVSCCPQQLLLVPPSPTPAKYNYILATVQLPVCWGQLQQTRSREKKIRCSFLHMISPLIPSKSGERRGKGETPCIRIISTCSWEGCSNVLETGRSRLMDSSPNGFLPFLFRMSEISEINTDCLKM